MSNDLKILKEAIDLIVQEVLGKFDFNRFKKIASGDIRRPEPRDRNQRINPWDIPSEYNDHPEIAYARDFLPIQSSGEAEGSSRSVFAYSGGKVLKIAMNQAGIAQNEAEVEIYKSNSNIGIVTKIYDYAPDYKWVVAELVKPFTGSEFKAFLGMSGDSFESLVYGIAAGRDLEQRIFNVTDIEKSIEYNKIKLDNLPTKANQQTKQHFLDIIRNYEQDLNIFKSIKPDSPIIKFVRDIVELMNKHKLAQGDIVLAKHYGRTVDGQIKLYDYGATEQVVKKHYDGARYSDSVGNSDDYTTGSRFGV